MQVPNNNTTFKNFRQKVSLLQNLTQVQSKYMEINLKSMLTVNKSFEILLGHITKSFNFGKFFLIYYIMLKSILLEIIYSFFVMLICRYFHQKYTKQDAISIH